jgi:hypothetical protein
MSNPSIESTLEYIGAARAFAIAANHVTFNDDLFEANRQRAIDELEAAIRSLRLAKP